MLKPSKVAPSITREFILLFLILILILGVGASFTWWMTRTEDTRMREEMLIQARMISKAINWELFKTLTGSEADLASSDYLRIKNQLSMIRSVHPQCRFIYLMGQRQDGTIFFFVDSESPDSKDYSPPGQVYDEVPDSYRQVFATRREAVVGPVSDRWGTWISALVPLAAPQNEKLIAVVGMDIDAHNWNQKIFIHSLTPIVTTLLFVVLLIFFFILQWRTVREKQRIANSEETLRANQRRLADIIEFLPDATLAIDKERRVIIWNKAIEKMTGIPAAEIIGKSDYVYTIPFYGEARPQLMDLVFEDREEIVAKYPNINREGDNLMAEVFCNALYDNKGAWVFAKASPLHDQAGNIIGAIESIRDITERKQAETELLRLATAIEQASENIIITDEKGVMQYVNTIVWNKSGVPREKIIGQNFFFPPGRSGETKESLKNIWETVSSGRIWQGRVQNRTHDGCVMLVDAVITPIKNSGGAIINYVAVSRDVTREVQLEQQLLQSQKMEAIGTLAGGIAHDFNNILGGIIGFAEIIKEEVQHDSQLVHNLDQILKLGDRASNLVRQILTFSRKTVSEHNPMQLSPLIKEVLNLLRATLPATIEIRQKLFDQGTMIKADPTQIHQVLMNLCTNAAHAMQGEGGVLEIELSPVDITTEDIRTYHDIMPGPYIKLTVRDTGTGIDKAIVNRIFDPFFTTKEKDKGTGMGLSVVHGIVKSHGGTITVESEPGEGSTFTVLLPLIIEANPQTAIETVSVIPTGHESILFVDDEAFLLDSGKSMLESLGYKVTALQSGTEALEVFQRTPAAFDLVITDQTMPNMTGYALAGC